MASIISSYTLTVIMYGYIVKKIGKFEGNYLLKNLLKIIIALLGMGIVLWICHRFVYIHSNILKLALYGGLSVVVYILILKLIHFEELDYIINLIVRKGKNKDELCKKNI